MGLKKYRLKRNFSVTSEPHGNLLRKKDTFSYVIQKHSASHLHYDFRLELGGVLKSWAVPKGPTLNPGVKRLAVEVEDHPIEYGKFEGIIPQGEYGGGTVIVWDEGVWKCDDDPYKSYRTGKLTFQLNGKKLHGKWRLVKLISNHDSKNKEHWLLFKLKDKYSRKNFDILKEKPLSVITNRSLNEIALMNKKQKKLLSPKKEKSIKQYNRNKFLKIIKQLPNIKKNPQPSIIKPQLATLVDNIPSGKEWVHEVKIDGYRIICIVKDGKIKLITRNNEDWTNKFSEIADNFRKLSLPDTILDGELAALNNEGMISFQALQNALENKENINLKYYVFDIIYLLGYELTETLLLNRKKLLSLLLNEYKTNRLNIEYLDHIQDNSENLLQKACQYSFEGIVSKRIDSPYQQSRTRNWLKIKCTHRQEFVISGITEPKGTRQHFGALLLGYFNDKNQLIYCGKVGTGFTRQSLQVLFHQLNNISQKFSQFFKPARIIEKNVKWIKPVMVCEVEFSGWTDDGMLRHPIFIGLRKDKIAKNVHKEQAVNVKRVLQKNHKKPSSLFSISGVSLTHAKKVFYPEIGFTKKDLAEYYEAISKWILPHIVKRPLSLLRCTSGIKEECFFQKNFSDSPSKYFKLITIHEKNKHTNYLTINNIKGLIALAQLDVLEIHPWNCRIEKIDKPDRMIFDLDPGVGVKWEQVLQGAVIVRDFLSALNLTSYIKTSGSKGVHIVVPLLRKHGWLEVKEFSHAIARKLATLYPKKFTDTVSKSKRTEKIFIDYLRNTRGATTVSAYSPRAKDNNASISMPLRWHELQHIRSSTEYNVSNIFKHLTSLKEDPWEEFFEIHQTISKKMQFLLKL